MTRPTSIELVAALDLDRRVLYQLLQRAQNDAHPRVVARLLKLLAENAKAWEQAVPTQRVNP